MDPIHLAKKVVREQYERELRITLHEQIDRFGLPAVLRNMAQCCKSCGDSGDYPAPLAWELTASNLMVLADGDVAKSTNGPG